MILFYQNGVEVDGMDFGITEIGKTNTIEVMIKNTYNDNISLSNEYSLDKDVKILEYVKTLKPQEYGKVILSFTPNLNRQESLKKKQIGFKVVIG